MFLLPKNIYVIENHDEALTKWENWCVKSSTLIHFDAHMDFDNTINKKHINIGNFIGNAIIEGLFDKFVWVIPSPSYHSIAGYKFAVKCCKEYLMNIHYYRKILCGNLQIKEQVIFYLCSIENLAEIINSDLDITLDIDIDYFVNPYIWFDFSCLLPDSKWISLLDFYKKAKYMIENSKIITIAKSVIGGFTPLRYEYLAEALKNLIQNKGVLDEQYKILENGLGNNPNSDLSKSIMHKNTSLSTLAWSLEVNTTNINKEYYNLLLSKYPNYSLYYFNLYQYLKMKMYNSTKQYLSIWLKYDEHSIMANLYSVKLAIAKKSKISDKTLNLLSNVDTEMEFDYLLGRYFFANKNYNEAIKMFNRVLSVLSDCQVKPWEGILSPYNYGHKLSPAKIDMYYKLALSHYKLKNYKDSYKYSSLLMRYGFKIGKEFYIYQKSRKKITGVDNKKVFYSNKYICLTIFVKIYNIFFGVNKKLIFRYYFFKSYFNNRKQYS